jgi:hypothetical protein
MPELRMAQSGLFGQVVHGHGVMGRRNMQLHRPANKYQCCRSENRFMSSLGTVQSG